MINLLANRYAVGAAGLLLGIAAVWGYGKYQYRQGVADTKAEVRLAQISIEQGMQYEADRADAKYRGAVAARQVAQNDLDSVQRELERVLDDLRDTEDAGTSERLNAASAGRLEGFAACVREYGSLAKDAARWVDQVNGLQGYVEAARKW